MQEVLGSSLGGRREAEVELTSEETMGASTTKPSFEKPIKRSRGRIWMKSRGASSHRSPVPPPLYLKHAKTCQEQADSTPRALYKKPLA